MVGLEPTRLLRATDFESVESAVPPHGHKSLPPLFESLTDWLLASYWVANLNQRSILSLYECSYDHHKDVRETETDRYSGFASFYCRKASRAYTGGTGENRTLIISVQARYNPIILRPRKQLNFTPIKSVNCVLKLAGQQGNDPWSDG